jgi:homoserine O-succinyltransferase
MSTVLEATNSVALPARTGKLGASKRLSENRVIDIGLVNNMPDPALVATERQFSGLLKDAGDDSVRIHLYHLPGVPRGEEARALLRERYRPVDDLYTAPVDALIVTGNEPRAPRLDDEPYWPALAYLIEWAKTHTISAVWSCLAAHAAVLHLDNIVRQRLPAKRSGAYVSQVESDALGDLPPELLVCHSRLNELKVDELEGKGYQIVSQSPGGHVDTFIKDYGSRFVFFQGHPEYGVDSLMREYRRDVGRYLEGQSESYPGIPENYFDDQTVERMWEFRRHAESARNAAMMAEYPEARMRSGLEERMRSTANAIYRNWLSSMRNRIVAEGIDRSATSR